jgi:Autoinducer synthase
MRDGTISANASGSFSDHYDDTDNAYLFGLYVDGELASSIRIHVATREHPYFPTLEVFPEYLQPQLDAGKVIIDPTRFVADERLSRIHRALPYATLRRCGPSTRPSTGGFFSTAWCARRGPIRCSPSRSA